MSLFEKLQTVIMLGAAAAGLLLGRAPLLAEYAAKCITPALMCMLFGLFLSIPIKDLKKSFFDVKFAATSLSINFIWIPVFGWLLGGVFLADSPALRIGYIMLLVTPCTDWHLVFTALARGNVALSAAMLPLNLLVQIILLPVYLFLFASMTGSVDFELLLKTIALVLLAPFGLAQIARALLQTGRALSAQALERIFSKGQFSFLCLAIASMFASQAGYLSGHLDVFYKLLLPVLLFFMINFVLVRILSKIMKFSFEDSVSLNLTTLARNSPIALAIAVTAFPNDPLIALALVIGPLIELPVLGVTAQILLWMRGKDRLF